MTASPTAIPLVVHVIYALGAGGLENGLVNIINRADPLRYRHAIVCLTESGSFEDRIDVQGVDVYALHKKPGNDVRVFLRLFFLLRKLRPDIVHTRNLAALEMQVLGLLMPRVKRVHGEHGRDVSDLYGNNPRYRKLRRLLSPLVHRFVCVSRDLSEWLCNEVGIDRYKVTQIYNGVDHSRFGSVAVDTSLLPDGFLIGTGHVVLGTVGRLAEVKDQERFVCAVEHILEQHPELSRTLRVIVVGDGPLRSQIEGRASNIQDVVWFAGERSDVQSLLVLMDVFVLPSLGEGISNTILEAMSAAKPVVASNVGGNPELVDDGETGLLFPARDTGALAKALLTLIGDEKMRVRMGKSAQQKVRERHDWQSTVDAYLAVYDQVLGRAPSAKSPGGN